MYCESPYKPICMFQSAPSAHELSLGWSCLGHKKGQVAWTWGEKKHTATAPLLFSVTASTRRHVSRSSDPLKTVTGYKRAAHTIPVAHPHANWPQWKEKEEAAYSKQGGLLCAASLSNADPLGGNTGRQQHTPTAEEQRDELCSLRFTPVRLYALCSNKEVCRSAVSARSFPSSSNTESMTM